MLKSRISGFHQDEFKDWVAELDCGHSQHMRHDPPWQSRPWVIKRSERDQRLGELIACKQCRDSS